MLYFLETPVLRFALLPYYGRVGCRKVKSLMPSKTDVCVILVVSRVSQFKYECGEGLPTLLTGGKL